MNACPRCGLEQPDGLECAGCGIIYAKWEARQRAPATAEAAPPLAPALPLAAPPARRGLPSAGPSAPVLRDVMVGLAQLVDAGIGLRQALQTLVETAPASARPALEAAAARIAAGASLADALAGAPALLSAEDAQRVRGAERIGATAQALREVAAGYGRRVEVRRQLWRRAAYPLAVLGAWAVLSPLPQVVIGGVGTYATSLVTNLTILGSILLAAAVGVPWLATRSPLAPTLRRWAWRAPWPATLVVTRARARFCRMLARNLEAGLGLPESLESAAAVTGDAEVSARVAAVLARVAAGEALAAPIVAAGLIAPGDRVVLATGEQAGALVGGLDALAARYEDQAERGAALLLRGVGAALTLVVLLHVAWQVYSGFQQTLGGGGALQDAFEQLDREMPQGLRGYPLGK